MRNRNSIELMFNDVGLTVTGTYDPGDPGQTSGPPERCWPPELANFDCESICVIGSTIDISPLLDSGTLEAIIDKAMEKAAEMLPDPGEGRYPDNYDDRGTDARGENLEFGGRNYP